MRLVESGPAGGAIFAADIARRFGLDAVVSYDMGGTTAKICLIEDFVPKTARTFEVARTYRFRKGSGMPISIPVIEMIEIGAGGGSIACGRRAWDASGPARKVRAPSPAPPATGAAAAAPAVTDADLVLGKIDPDNFAGGAIRLSTDAGADAAITRDVGARLGLDAARRGLRHLRGRRREHGQRRAASTRSRTARTSPTTCMIAFGGAGAAPCRAPVREARHRPLPCAAGRRRRLGDRLPEAPFAYEALASKLVRLSSLRRCRVNASARGLTTTRPRASCRSGTSGRVVREITAFMRYAGQGWEIPVAAARPPFEPSDACSLEPRRFRGRLCALLRPRHRRSRRARDRGRHLVGQGERRARRPPAGTRSRMERDAGRASRRPARLRSGAGACMVEPPSSSATRFRTGDRIGGPAVIVERETSTVVTTAFDA